MKIVIYLTFFLGCHYLIPTFFQKNLFYYVQKFHIHRDGGDFILKFLGYMFSFLFFL